MRRCSRRRMAVLAACIMSAGILCIPSTVYAKKITSFHQLESLAEKEVKGAHIIEVDKDYEKGIIVYEARLLKGKKEYDLTYRASDGKLVAYGWEIRDWYVERGSGNLISQSRCRRLAKKRVPGGSINSLVRKRSDGVEIYKVKMKKGGKKYELEFHARTGKLLEYDWEFTSSAKDEKNYIGLEKARKAALEKSKGGTVIKAKFDRDDGVPVYEVEIVKDEYEYDIKIHAKTGKIIDFALESIYD